MLYHPVYHTTLYNTMMLHIALYIYIYTCVYVHIHIYKYIYTYICICHYVIYIYIYTYTHIYHYCYYYYTMMIYHIMYHTALARRTAPGPPAPWRGRPAAAPAASFLMSVYICFTESCFIEFIVLCLFILGLMPLCHSVQMHVFD